MCLFQMCRIFDISNMLYFLHLLTCLTLYLIVTITLLVISQIILWCVHARYLLRIFLFVPLRCYNFFLIFTHLISNTRNVICTTLLFLLVLIGVYWLCHIFCRNVMQLLVMLLCWLSNFLPNSLDLLAVRSTLTSKFILQPVNLSCEEADLLHAIHNNRWFFWHQVNFSITLTCSANHCHDLLTIRL